jgi:hypothetical protein
MRNGTKMLFLGMFGLVGVSVTTIARSGTDCTPYVNAVSAASLAVANAQTKVNSDTAAVASAQAALTAAQNALKTDQATLSTAQAKQTAAQQAEAKAGCVQQVPGH